MYYCGQIFRLLCPGTKLKIFHSSHFVFRKIATTNFPLPPPQVRREDRVVREGLTFNVIDQSTILLP